MGNLLGATADPDPLSTILSSIFIVVLVLFSGFSRQRKPHSALSTERNSNLKRKAATNLRKTL